MSSNHETLRHKSALTSGRPDRRRVVITGMSAITPVGNSVAEMWDSLLAGRSGAGPITVLDASGYPCQIGCELKDFDPERYMGRKEARRMASATQLAVAAAGQAIKDANWTCSAWMAIGLAWLWVRPAAAASRRQNGLSNIL